MARRCEICGKGPIFGSNVSHAHNVTNRRWMPNLQRMRVIIEGKPQKIDVCTTCLRSGRVERYVKG